MNGSYFPNGNFGSERGVHYGYVCLQRIILGGFEAGILKRLAKLIVAGVLTSLVALLFLKYSAEIRRNVVERDSIAYWTAGSILLHHADPYDPVAVLSVERQQRYSQDKPLVLRTPPWSLFLVLPLGLLSPLGAWILWTAISLASLVLAMRICWRLYGNEIPRGLFSVIGYTFAPIPACLVAGQMGLVLLLGVMLFLWWEKDRPLLAGAALILPFAKPHLLVLFWFALLLWMAGRNRGRVALGFMAALVTATSVPLIFDPQVFQHYRAMLRQAAIGYEFIPALSGVVRLLFFRNRFWVQFVPMSLGLIWCGWFVFRNRSRWDWRQHLPVLLVVSVLTTPYAWLTDEVVVLPAILQAAALAYAHRDRMRVSTKLALMVFVSLNVLLLLILRFKIPFSTGIYFWSSLVWFAWYLYGSTCEQRGS